MFHQVWSGEIEIQLTDQRHAGKWWRLRNFQVKLAASSTWKSPGPSLPYNKHLGFTPEQLRTRNGGIHDGHRQDGVHRGVFSCLFEESPACAFEWRKHQGNAKRKEHGCIPLSLQPSHPQPYASGMACSYGVEVTERMHRRGSLHPPLITGKIRS